MLREEILPFLNKKITIIKGNNFGLTGIITEVHEESIVFETHQAISTINISQIKEIVMKKEGY